MSMTERDICEKIVKQGHCGSVDCHSDRCPLSTTYGNGNCSIYQSIDAAKQWLKDNPEPKDIETMVAEFDAKPTHTTLTYAEKQEDNVSFINSRATRLQNELILIVDNVRVASFSKSEGFGVKSICSIKEAKALNTWLTKMLKEA